MTATRLAVLDLPEGNAMRAPGEAVGLLALEAAMDELAEKLKMDPVQLRIINDTQVDPEKPSRQFSQRDLVGCLKTGAERFGWNKRNPVPGQVRDGRWLVGMGMASAFRDNVTMKSGARVDWRTIDHGDSRAPVRYPGPFVRFSDHAIQYRRRAPLLGEHNTDVLVEELGIATAELAALQEKGVVA